MRIRGVAEIIATAAVSFAGDGSGYNGARHFSANLGLIPKEFSSGEKSGQIIQIDYWVLETGCTTSTVNLENVRAKVITNIHKLILANLYTKQLCS